MPDGWPLHARLGREQLPTAVLVAVGLAVAAGLIHLQAAYDHLDEARVLAVLFVLAAAAQCGWGALLFRRPGRRVMLAGCGLTILLLAAWAVSRTIGLPLGLDASGVEPVGTLDGVCVADQLVLAAILLSELRGRRPVALPAAGLLLVFFSALVLAGGVHAH